VFNVTSVPFLVWFNVFALTMGFYWGYTLLLKSYALMCIINLPDNSQQMNCKRYTCALASRHLSVLALCLLMKLDDDGWCLNSLHSIYH